VPQPTACGPDLPPTVDQPCAKVDIPETRSADPARATRWNHGAGRADDLGYRRVADKAAGCVNSAQNAAPATSIEPTRLGRRRRSGARSSRRDSSQLSTPASRSATPSSSPGTPTPRTTEHYDPARGDLDRHGRALPHGLRGRGVNDGNTRATANPASDASPPPTKARIGSRRRPARLGDQEQFRLGDARASRSRAALTAPVQRHGLVPARCRSPRFPSVAGRQRRATLGLIFHFQADDSARQQAPPARRASRSG